MLRVEGLRVSYDGLQVLWGVDLEVSEGEIVSLLGPNGAGKSTLMNAISGVVPSQGGSIRFRDATISGLRTHKIVASGIAHVLERRRVFPYLSVRKNLILGSWLREARDKRGENFERVLSLLPALKDKLDVEARLLSGGQQQQLAIGRGLMSSPSLLLLDEPFLGLYPAIVDEIAGVIRELSEEGMTVLFIEQNVELALSLSDRTYVLQSGRVALSGESADLASTGAVTDVFMGTAT